VVIDNSNNQYQLGVAAMDSTHDEFIQLVNQLGEAGTADFIRLFPAFLAHTEKHFHAEEELMQGSQFPAIEEHRNEHNRVLRDVRAMQAQVARGGISFARAYVIQQVPEWFNLHASTMDSALAAHLKRVSSTVDA